MELLTDMGMVKNYDDLWFNHFFAFFSPFGKKKESTKKVIYITFNIKKIIFLDTNHIFSLSCLVDMIITFEFYE